MGGPVPSMDERFHAQFQQNPLLWAHYFFPHHFRKDSPDFHLALMQAACSYRHLAVASPRESAKSTILTFAYPFNRIVYKRKRFIIIVQNTFTKAAMSLDTMKREVMDNLELKKIYPGITLSKDATGDSIFKHPDGFTTLVLCKGMDQIGSIRGVKFGAYRPDLVICDDLEDDKMVMNPVLRQELTSLYDEALEPAGEKGQCQFIVVGTILHDDSLMAKMVSKEYYPEYHKMFYAAHIRPHKGEANGESSLWPEKWSVEYLRELSRIKPTTYAKEYQNDPVSGKAAKFKRENFRYWRIVEGHYELLNTDGSIKQRGDLSLCKAAIACDLAWMEKRESDATVIMPGFLTPYSDLLIDTYTHEFGVDPDQVGEILFSMEARLRAITGNIVPIGFEKGMLDRVTQWLLKRSMRERNHFLLTQELEWDLDKEKRIQIKLQPRYAQHTIYHKSGMGTLELQLERFPSSTHDDLPDALQGLVQLLQYPKNLPNVKDPENQFDRMRQLAIDRVKPKEVTPLFGITHPSLLQQKFPHFHSPL